MKQIFENCQEKLNFTISRPYKRPYNGFFGFFEHFYLTFFKVFKPKKRKILHFKTIKTVLKGHITDFLLILYKKRPKNEQEGTKNEWKLTKKGTGSGPEVEISLKKDS